VIATTRRGDPNNILFVGSHSDSVDAGPGINDNGSGSAGLLEVALQLAHWTTKNKVRFGWWTAEEEGLLGSEHYVAQLPAAEQLKVRLYLNFDMIASGNGVLARYDGDGSRFNETGPAGSDLAEALFAKWFESKGHPQTESEFTGRSDYGPFLDVNVPCGGLDTGAEKLKTEEEARIFGGVAGLAYDVNYHGAGDTVANMSKPFFEINSKAIAHAVATYGASFEGFPPRSPPAVVEKRTTSGRRPKRVQGVDLWVA
jgi:carboxypeptidase Q